MCSHFRRCCYTAAAEKSASYSAPPSFPSWGGGSQGVTPPASAAVGGHRETGERLCAPAARPTGAPSLSACRLEEVRARASRGAAVNRCAHMRRREFCSARRNGVNIPARYSSSNSV
ncbi:hypothetical protein MTO96_008266 [Rhipicephalus appendiculatus]